MIYEAETDFGRRDFPPFLNFAFDSRDLISVWLVGHPGLAQTLLADSGMEVLRQASKSLPRQAGRILRTAMRLAVPKALNHLPDELLQQAIEELR